MPGACLGLVAGTGCDYEECVGGWGVGGGGRSLEGDDGVVCG